MRAIESCTLAWGGEINGLFPASPSGIDPRFSQMFTKHDPSAVVDAAGLGEDYAAAVRKTGRAYHRWENPQGSLFVDGALQYAALNAFGEHLGPNQQHRTIVINPTWHDPNDRLDLHVAAIHGRINETAIGDLLLQHRWASQISYASFTSLAMAKFESVQDLMLGDLPGLSVADKPIESASYQVTGPISLTMLGIRRGSPSFSLMEMEDDSPSRRPFNQKIVVTGQAGAVADLCLFWNLRAERPNGWPFPMWVPLDELDSTQGAEAIAGALGRMQFRSGQWPPAPTDLTILSATVKQSELQSRLATRFPDAVFKTHSYDSYVSGEWENRIQTTQREVSFQSGSARIPLPKLERIDYFGGFDRIAYEVAVDSRVLPSQMQGQARPLAPRITYRGRLEGWSHGSYWPDYWNIGLPSGWECLAAVADESGYQISTSDKGHLAVGQLQLLEDISDLQILASSKIFHTLQHLSRVKGKSETPRAFFTERNSYRFSDFSKAWRNVNARALVPWLVSKGILFRGAMLRCPVCTLKTWYSIDTVAAEWICDGCRTHMPVPVDPSNTVWSYRINELVARGFDQGTLVHLLALHCAYFGFLLDDLWGMHPGILLTPDPEGPNPAAVQPREVDVVVLAAGRLIIGECKQSASSFKDDEVVAMANLARQTGSSKLIFAAPDQLPDVDWFLNATTDFDGYIELYGRDRLFDGGWTRRPENNLSGPEFEERADAFLARVSRRLAGAS